MSGTRRNRSASRPAATTPIAAPPNVTFESPIFGPDKFEIVAPGADVKAAVKRFGTTVLLKGATQYVSGPGDDRVHLAVPGPAWTAQAGSGDVLAGICATLLAAGLDPVVAVCGASIQALTAAAHPGPYPPQDLARLLPETIAGLPG